MSAAQSGGLCRAVPSHAVRDAVGGVTACAVPAVERLSNVTLSDHNDLQRRSVGVGKDSQYHLSPHFQRVFSDNNGVRPTLGVGANTLCQSPDTRCRISPFLVGRLGILIQSRRPPVRRLISGRVVGVIDTPVVLGDVLFHHAL